MLKTLSRRLVNLGLGGFMFLLPVFVAFQFVARVWTVG